MCNGAPNLQLELGEGGGNTSITQIGASRVEIKPRAASAKFAKGHNIVQKDYYRLMKEDTTVSKH